MPRAKYRHGRRMADIPARPNLPSPPARPCRRRSMSARSGSRCARSSRARLGEPPVIYDTSGGPIPIPMPTLTSPAAAELRAAGSDRASNVEDAQREEIRPEDNGQLGPDRSGGVSFSKRPQEEVRAQPGANVADALCPARHRHAEMEYVAERTGISAARPPRRISARRPEAGAPPSPTM